MGANERLADRLILHAEMLIRVENGISSRVSALLRKLRAEVSELAAAVDDAASLQQTELLLAKFRADLDGVRAAIGTKLADELEDLLSVEYRIAFNALKGAIPKALVPDLRKTLAPTRDILNLPVHGVTFDQALKNLFNRLDGGVSREVRDAWAKGFQRAIEQGMGFQDAARAAMREAEALGLRVKELRELVTDRAERDLGAIVHGHTAQAVDQAARQVWRENKQFLKGIQHMATLDIKTCPVCAALDGTQYLYEPGPGELSIEDMPLLPIHPACRCCRVPVLNEEIDPDPAPVKSYEEWFGGLDPSKQEDILGPRRYALWEGGMPLEKMVGADNRLRPVSDLEKL